MKTVQIDATGQPLGRLASRIAFLLRGKHDVTYEPRHAPDVIVHVTNLSKVGIAKKKLAKQFHRTSGYPGNVKTETLGQRWERSPEATLRATVKGMLPSNTHRETLLRHLHCEL